MRSRYRCRPRCWRSRRRACRRARFVATTPAPSTTTTSSRWPGSAAATCSRSPPRTDQGVVLLHPGAERPPPRRDSSATTSAWPATSRGTPSRCPDTSCRPCFPVPTIGLCTPTGASSTTGCPLTNAGADGSSPAARSRRGTWGISRRCSRSVGWARAEAGDGPGRDRHFGYLTTQSDVAALLVFDHQVHAANLLTRLNWEARAGARPSRSTRPHRSGGLPVVRRRGADPGQGGGPSGFAQAFAARGPREARVDRSAISSSKDG